MNTTALWRITLLGALRAEQRGSVVTRFRSQKAGGLMTYLALFPRHTRVWRLKRPARAPDFPGGAWFVPLAELWDAERFFETIAAVLRLPQTSAVPAHEQVLAELQRRGKIGLKTTA